MLDLIIFVLIMFFVFIILGFIYYVLCVLCFRMKDEVRIFISFDGLYNNVLKTKFFMCFSEENVDEFCFKLIEILIDFQKVEIQIVLGDIIDNVEKFTISVRDLNQNWGRIVVVFQVKLVGGEKDQGGDLEDSYLMEKWG